MSKDPNESPKPRDEISRREFMRVSALAAGGAAIGACHSSLLDVTDPTDTGTDDWTDPVVTDPTAWVSAVTGTDLSTMTQEVLAPLGGIQSVVHEGESVFIKPNMVSLPGAEFQSPFAVGECTKPEILVAVAEGCLQAGASRVTIGDGSHALVLPWDRATTLDGSTSLAAEVARLSTEYGKPVRVASLETDSPEWVELPTDTYLGTIAVSSLVTDADRVISIPVAKTHCWAQLTLALKNFIGIASLARYGDIPSGVFDRGVVMDHSSTSAIAAIYLDIVKRVEPDLAIVDFSLGVEGDGPNLSHGGSTVDMRDRLGSYALLASTDLVAADSIAALIMSHNPTQVTQLVMGYQMGLGEMRDDKIEVIGARISDLRVSWTPAQLRNQLSPARAACPGQGPARIPMYG